jgi:predicted porin
MKKTMIALAAVAAVGAASAQVSITGSTTAYWMNTSDNSSAGMVLGGAAIVFAASEDMGGGYSAAAKMEMNMDGGRSDKNTRSDRSISLAGPIGSLTFANTRSGGTAGAAFVAPANLWNDFWGAGSNVLSRGNVDDLVLAVPLSKELRVLGKYIEGACNTVNTSATNTLNNTVLTADGVKAALSACGAVDGAAQPGSTSYVATGKWASGPLMVIVDAVSTTFSDNYRTNLAAAGRTAPRTQSYNATANYDAGFAKFGLGYDSPRRGKAEGTDQGAVLASFAAPLGGSTVGLNYGLRDGQSIIQLGAAYSLSKRTTLNLSWGQYTNAADTAGAPVAALVESALSLSHSF